MNLFTPLHPPSKMTVIAGMYDPIYCSSWPTCFIDSSRRVDHHSPMHFTAATNDCFAIAGIPSAAIASYLPKKA